MTAFGEDTGKSMRGPARRDWASLSVPDQVRSVRWLDDRTVEVIGLMGGVSRWTVPSGTKIPPPKDCVLTEARDE